MQRVITFIQKHACTFILFIHGMCGLFIHGMVCVLYFEQIKNTPERNTTMGASSGTLIPNVLLDLTHC